MRTLSVLTHVAVVVAVAASAAGQEPAPNRQPAASARSEAPAYEGLLDQYCVSCHNASSMTAGLALDTLDPEDLS